MLPRAGLRGSKASQLRFTTSPHAAAASLRIRTYASKPSRPPPPPLGSRPARPPPPPKAFTPSSASGRTRQTSPGTTVPQDQTWKPKDGIKFGNADAASPRDGAGTVSAAAEGARHAASSPVEGVRTTDAAATQSPLDANDPTQKILQMFQEGKGVADIAQYVQRLPPDQQKKLQDMTPNAAPLSPEQVQRVQELRASGKSWDDISREVLVAQAAPQEPMAQKLDADEPVTGSVREKAQEKMAESENTTPPPPQTPPQQTGPLPDLRHGIPSTFDLEFGQAKARAQQQDAAESEEDKLELTSEGQRRSRDDGEEGERQYDRKAYETSLDRRRAMLMNYLYASFLVGALLSGFYLGRPFSAQDGTPSDLDPDDATGWSPQKIWKRMRGRLGNQVGHYTEPAFPKLLPDVPESQRAPFTLVMSLEDLMIHTTWDTKHGYRTAKRPGIDYFIRYLSQYYELVLFTSAPRAMADPIVAKLDPYHFIMWPLGREATKYEKGEYVKDLSYLNRDLKKTIIVDTHAPHVKNQPENAIILPKWSGDPKDPHTKDLVALIPFLEYVATMGTDDVRQVLKSFEGQSIPEEFARREQIAREKFQAQLAAEQKRKPRFSIGSIAAGLGVQGGGMGGGMQLADGQSVAEGLRQGKMLSDQIREQGQKQYEHLEKQIREHGEEWLREEAEELKKAQEVQMKEMKAGAFSWFGGSK